MRRRDLIKGIAGSAVAWPLAAHAQQLEKVARVGFLRQAGPHAKQFDAFRDGLRAAGYVEGLNLLIEQRYAAGAYERLGGLAADLVGANVADLVRANVDVIVVDGTVAAKACKDATATIPVVFALAVDPVADGLAASFAHPGGNLTGLTMTAGYGLAGKRVELLKDMVAALSRLAVLVNPNNPALVSFRARTSGWRSNGPFAGSRTLPAAQRRIGTDHRSSDSRGTDIRERYFRCYRGHRVVRAI